MGVQFGLSKMNAATIPRHTRDAGPYRRSVQAHGYLWHDILRTSFRAVTEEIGLDPAESSVRLMLVGGEPGTGVKNTRDRLQGLW